jgi:hypothetical protein
MGAFRSRQQKIDPSYDLLPPRPLPRTPLRPEPRADVVDAEYVTVRDTPRRSFDARSYNDNLRDAATKTAPAANRGLAPRLSSAIEAGERVLARLSADLFSALVAIVVVIVFGLAGGFSLMFETGGTQAVAATPTTLSITHVSLTPQDANGMPVLLINGVVENNTAGIRKVPRIRAEFRQDGRMIASMLVTPPVLEIGPGQSHGFAAKLRHPGGKMPEVRLSFTDTDASGS